jgi:3-demethylubiquinone-9 3-methyltransferase
MKPKNTICLWFDKDAHEAARFYAATFPDSAVRRPSRRTPARRATCGFPSSRTIPYALIARIVKFRTRQSR